MRGVSAAALVVAVSCGLVACGLSVTGLMGGAQAESEGGTGAEAGQRPPPPIADAGGSLDMGLTCGADACGLTTAVGWSLVTLTNRATPCPSGFATTDIVENPVAPATACTCACNVTGTPSCTTGTVATKYDYNADSGACGSTASALVANASGTCISVGGFSNGEHELFPAPQLAGTAACRATTTPNKGVVQADAIRACTPPSCAEACLGGVFKTCLLAAGDQPCPAGAPEKHLVGSDVDVTCPACGCTTAGAPASCNGNWTMYSDNACGSLVSTLTPGVCTFTARATVRSYRWNPTAFTVTCATTPAADAGAPSLVGATTICCK